MMSEERYHEVEKMRRLDDTIAEILRLRGILAGLAADFERASNATPYREEAMRLSKCAEFCRISQFPEPEAVKIARAALAPEQEK